jgi:hypothetical protein
VRDVLALLGIVVLLSSCSLATSAATIGTESHSVSGFRIVEMSGPGDLIIEQTGTESLTIEADEDLLPRLTSDVADGMLRLGGARGITSTPVSYRLTVKDLEGPEVSGSGHVRATQLTTPHLISRISGSGTITVSGQAGDQAVELSGSSNYRGDDLASTRARVRVSGDGDAPVRVSEVLDVQITGSGSVTDSGEPQVNQHVTGSGQVIRESP